MYHLKYKDYILHDMRLADEKLIIRDPSVKLAVSKGKCPLRWTQNIPI